MDKRKKERREVQWVLKEQYKKETDGKSYLILPKGVECFEEQMIQKAMPEGVLPMVKSECTDTYKYDISGKKTLAMTFDRVPMNAEQIETILRGIFDVLERGREYLLTEENFVLLPEFIYSEIPSYEVTLCYYPEYGVPFVEQMGKLFEMFLNRVDYREEKAIAMVYALYMQLQEPDMTPEQMREKLREQSKAVPEKTVVLKTEKKEAVKEPERLAIEREEVSLRREERVVKQEIRKETLWNRLRKEVGAKLLHGTGKSSVFSEEPHTVVPMPCVMEDVPEWGAAYTKVLSVKKKEESPVLVSKKTGETVALSKFPFYIGSLPEYMDYIISRETVSRFHAKLIKQGEEIYLTDLNSTNGTKINGRMLNVKEQVRLEEGDCILFADVEFVFLKTYKSE